MPAGVLSRDLQAYQSAVGRYQQAARNYNHAGKVYNNSVVMYQDMPVVLDSNGQRYTVAPDGKLNSINGIADFGGWQYSATPLPEDNRFRLLRQNPNPDGSFPTRPEPFVAPRLPDRPDATQSQLRDLGGAQAIDAERGLISDTINQQNRRVF